MSKSKNDGDRLGRLEQVFDAIVNAWTDSGTTTSKPASTQGSTLVSKLMSFASELEPAELDELSVVLGAAARAGKQVAEIPETVSGDTEGISFMRDLQVRVRPGQSSVLTPGDLTPQLGPTVTITTTVTVAASHPWITCVA